MAKKFRGFNEEQTGLIANKLGYKGSIDGFNEWLVKNQEAAARLSRMTEKARSYVEDSQNMAEGGSVKKPAPTPTWNKNLPGDVNPLPNWYRTKDQKEGEGIYLGKDPKMLAAHGPKDADGNPIDVATYKQSLKGTAAEEKPAIAAKDASPTTNQLLKKQNAENFITPAETSNVHWNQKQLIDKNSGNAGQTTPAKTTPNVNAAQVGQASTAATPQTTKAHTVGTDLVTNDVKKSLSGLEAAKGTVSKNSQVTAATALPSANATVQGQLEKLMASFDGTDPPAWAAGAMRMANAAMAARGLGASSMAGGAVTQAAMESAISIAAQDAATFSQFEMQNLNNRQQARLQNAQSFLQMDLANLNNEQQTAIFKSQAVIQSLFTDQAATNASAQFNATSQNQTDQFFANLKAQVATFNASQQNAIKTANMESKNQVGMFNTSQTNAMNQFNAQIKAQREEFNANNRLVIDQANAKWRQQIATLDNANANENNRLNAQLATGLTSAAYANLWQNERDLMAYAFTSSENAAQRATQIVLQKMANDTAAKGYKVQGQAALGSAAGAFVSSIVDGVFDNWDSIF